MKEQTKTIRVRVLRPFYLSRDQVTVVGEEIELPTDVGMSAVHGGKATRITPSVGTISAGTLIGTIEAASDDQGTNGATVATFTTVTTGNDAPNVQKVTLPVTIGAYLRYVGTLSAGTGDIAVTLLYSPKTA